MHVCGPRVFSPTPALVWSSCALCACWLTRLHERCFASCAYAPAGDPAAASAAAAAAGAHHHPHADEDSAVLALKQLAHNHVSTALCTSRVLLSAWIWYSHFWHKHAIAKAPSALNACPGTSCMQALVHAGAGVGDGKGLSLGGTGGEALDGAW